MHSNKHGGQTVFRFMEPRWADALVDHGSLRINSIASFRQQEDAQGDPLDSTTAHSVKRMWIADTAKDPLGVATAASLGIGIAGCKDVTISGVTAVHPLPGYALCLTTSRDPAPFAPEGKTALLEFLDIPRLAQLITDAAPDRLGVACRWQVVAYSDHGIIEGRGVCPPPSPFVKRTRFAHENEMRMFWGADDTGPIDLVIPAIRKGVQRLS